MLILLFVKTANSKKSNSGQDQRRKSPKNVIVTFQLRYIIQDVDVSKKLRLLKMPPKIFCREILDNSSLY